MTWSWSAADLRRLGQYLADRDLCGPEIDAHPVGDGHSNLTYLVSDGRRTVVVRRPPPPPTPPGAHDVVREARLVAALSETDVPVPRVLAVAAAGAILDVPVVVTEFIDGVVITETTPAPLDSPASRRQIGLSAIDTLAELHAVDWRALGLGDFGRPAGFNARHLGRVCALIADESGVLPTRFASLADALREQIPAESGAAVLHNDFRLGNLIVASAPPAGVIAVLDWELATIGDPLLDLGYFLSSYPQHGEQLTPTAKMGTAVLEEGYPDRAELTARYCSRTGSDLAEIDWYSALAQFKLATLYEYGRRRAVTGMGDSYFADEQLVDSFLRAGEELVC